MLKQISKEFKKDFLLKFTRELIRNSAPEEIFKLKEVIKEDENKPTADKKIVKEILKEKEKELSILKKEEKREKIPVIKNIKKNNLKRSLESLKRMRPILRIPEPKLPQTFDYLKPTPTNKEIDLEKLNPLIQDPLVKVIECNGPEENIVVSGAMGKKPTSIILNKEEIDKIIEKFSEEAKIPVHEGVFKAVVGKLIFSAIISDMVGSKFIIKKIIYSPKIF